MTPAEMRERWLRHPLIAALASERMPWWAADLFILFLIFQLARGFV